MKSASAASSMLLKERCYRSSDRRRCAKWLRQQADYIEQSAVDCCVEAAVTAYQQDPHSSIPTGHHHSSTPTGHPLSGSSSQNPQSSAAEHDFGEFFADARDTWRRQQRQQQQEDSIPTSRRSTHSTHNVMEAVEVCRAADREAREQNARDRDLQPFRGTLLRSADRAVAQVEALCNSSESACQFNMIELDGMLGQWQQGQFVSWLRAQNTASTSGSEAREGHLLEPRRISGGELHEQVRRWWDQERPSTLRRPTYFGRKERVLRQQLVMGERERDSCWQLLPELAGRQVLQLVLLLLGCDEPEFWRVVLSSCCASIAVDCDREAAEIVPQALRSFKKLRLHMRELTHAAAAAALKCCIRKSRHLIELSIKLCELGEAGSRLLARVLLRNQTIEALDASANRIGDSGVQHIMKVLSPNQHLEKKGLVPPLHSLCLSLNNLTSESSHLIGSTLSHSKHLTALDVSMNQFGAEGVVALCAGLGNTCQSGCRRCRELREQCLWPQEPAHCSSLPADPADPPKLTYLDISGGCAGEAADSIADALKRCQHVSYLVLGMNHLYSSSPEALSEALAVAPALSHLDLRSNRLEGDWAEGIAHALATTQTLHTLDLSDNRLGPNDALFLSEGLQRNYCLKRLFLDGNSLGPSGAASLSFALEKVDCPVEELRLKANSIGGQGAAALALALHRNHRLTCLDVQSNQIGPLGAQALSEALLRNHALVQLQLGGSNQIQDSGAAALLAAIERISLEQPRQSKLRLLQIQAKLLGRELVRCLKATAATVCQKSTGLPAVCWLTGNGGQACITLHLNAAGHSLTKPALRELGMGWWAEVKHIVDTALVDTGEHLWWVRWSTV